MNGENNEPVPQSVDIDSLLSQGGSDVDRGKRVRSVDEKLKEVFTPSNESRQILNNLEKLGINARVISLQSHPEIQAVVAVDAPDSGDKLTVFRGVRSLESATKPQVPYAMRLDTEEGYGRKNLDNAYIKDVEKLAGDPSYNNTLEFYHRISSELSLRQKERYERDLDEMEDWILFENSDMRDALMFQQVLHPGGVSDSGLSPYVSVTYSAHEASGYSGSGVVQVINVEPDMVDDFKSGSDEACYRGMIRTQDIRAFIPKAPFEAISDLTERKKLLDQIVLESNTAPTGAMSSGHVEEIRSSKEERENNSRSERKAKDVDQVARKRLRDCMRDHEDVPEISEYLSKQIADTSPLTTEVYINSLRQIYDVYFRKISEKGINLENRNYISKRNSREKNFDREKPDLDMLNEMKSILSSS